MKDIEELTDEELIRYAIAKSKLTSLELELVVRLEEHLDQILILLDPNEEIPKLLN
jgi:hypothetical protein